MKKHLPLLLLTAGAIIATHVFVVRLLSWQRGVIPFTAVKIDTHYDAKGEVSKTLQSLVGVRGDGSSVEVLSQTAPDGRQVAKKRLIDVMERKRMIIDGLTDSVTTYFLSEKAAAHYAFKRLGTCVENAPSERSEMLGFSVEKRNSEIEDAGNLLKVEEWVSPDLNCMALRQVVRVGPPGGPFVVDTITDIASLTRGEPDRSHFAAPTTGLVERSPGEVLAEFSRRYNRPFTPGSAAALDQSYFAHRSPSH